MYNDLILKAKKLRQDTFNTFIEQGEAHIGGAFSMIEMILALYEKVLKEDERQKFEKRDSIAMYWGR